MQTFIMLTRISPDAAGSPKALEDLEQKAMALIRKDCPDVEWLESYAVLGGCDYVDIFRANDLDAASRVSTIIRTQGRASTEVWPATTWKRFKRTLREL